MRTRKVDDLRVDDVDDADNELTHGDNKRIEANTQRVETTFLPMHPFPIATPRLQKDEPPKVTTGGEKLPPVPVLPSGENLSRATPRQIELDLKPLNSSRSIGSQPEQASQTMRNGSNQSEKTDKSAPGTDRFAKRPLNAETTKVF